MVHTFLKGICPKVNVIVRLEFELAYYDSGVHRFNPYTPIYNQANQTFCNILLAWSRFPVVGITRDHEGDEPNWTVRCRARLIIFVCHLLNEFQRLRARPRNSWIWNCLYLPGRWNSFCPNEIYWTIWLLYCILLWLYLLLNTDLWLFPRRYGPVRSISCPIRLSYTLICSAFKSYTEGSDTVSECRWAGTHLDRLCWPVHGSGQVCSGSVDSRSRFALTVIFEPMGPYQQALTLLGGASWWTRHLRRLSLGECRRGPRHFGECWA